MNLGLEGRVALVMGASKGLGRAIAEALAREGACVGMASRSRARLEESARAIDGETAAFVADTADLERMRLLPGEVEKALGGPIEVLVTNTGGPPAGGALDSSIDEWRSAYTSLVLAPRVLIEVTLPGMRERAWGKNRERCRPLGPRGDAQPGCLRSPPSRDYELLGGALP